MVYLQYISRQKTYKKLCKNHNQLVSGFQANLIYVKPSWNYLHTLRLPNEQYLKIKRTAGEKVQENR